MKILIVDDSFVSRLLLSATLIDLGHTVLQSEDGEQAYQQFQLQRPDVIISDWLMPGMDGPTLCGFIRRQKQERYPYFILLTALTSKKHFIEGMEAGADDFLHKPFDPDELRVRLRVAERMLTLQNEVIQLSGLLPICSSCKNIRDDKGYWERIEGYITRYSDVKFTHGICPNCAERLYPEAFANLESKNGLNPGGD